MTLGMLLLGGIFLSAILLNFSQEPDDETNDHFDEDNGEHDNDFAQYLSDFEYGGAEENEEGERDPNLVDPSAYLYVDGNTLTVSIPKNGAAKVDVTQSGVSVEEIRIESNHDSVQLLWGHNNDGAWISISSGEGKLNLGFPGLGCPPLHDIVITSYSTAGEFLEVNLSDYITDQDSAAFLFGSHDLSPHELHPNSFLIGGASSDAITLHGDEANAEVSFERGVLQTSQPWTGQIYGGGGNDTVAANDGNFLIYGGGR